MRYQDFFLTESKLADNQFSCARKNASNIDYSSRQIKEPYPTMNKNRREKKLPLAFIALIALNLKTLLALNMSAEKLSSPRGDPDLLLCGPWGRPKKKKVRYLLRPLGVKKVKIDQKSRKKSK